MSFRIEISEDLRDYIERLNYEKVRYEDLLKTVHRNICPMTDEEWQSSLEYFTNLRDEANAAYDAMCEFVNEEYGDVFKGESWFIDFKECAIFPAAEKDKVVRKIKLGQRVSEQYNDQLCRMYPPEEAGYEVGKTLEFNGYGCKDISFQVTDACNMACTYCLVAGTKILLPDFTTKNIEDVEVGDKVMAFPEYSQGKRDVLEVAEVTATFKRSASVLRITFDNGTSIDVTEGHPILTRRNAYDNRYDYVEAGKLTVGRHVYYAPDVIIDTPVINDDYKIGYLLGIIMGDGSLKKYKIKKWNNSWVYKFRLALKDTEATKRAKSYLDDFGVNTYIKPFKISMKYNLLEDSIFSCAKETYNKLSEMIAANFRVNKSESYFRGYLAGIYDAEGHISKNGIIRICNTNRDIINEIAEGMNTIGVDYVIEETAGTKNKDTKWNIRVLTMGKDADNKLHHNMDFIMKVSPAISRKGFDAFIGRSLMKRAKVTSIEHLYGEVDVYNFETSSHTYFANGIAVHNCYQHHKGEHRMPFEVAKEFIDHLLAADDMVNRYVDTSKCCGLIFGFIGGEPWLEIDLITQISDYVIGEMFRLKHPLAIRFMLSVCSNGLLHFDPRVQVFIKRHIGHLSYNISIDGDRELHDSCRVDKAGNGTYDRAIAGVYQFRDELGGIMGSKMTISPGNVAHIGRAVKKMIESGYEHINLNCVYEEGWTNAHANILYWQLHELVDYICEKGLQDVVSLSILNDKAGEPLDDEENQNWCGGLGLMLGIDYKGDMYPCIRYMESSVGFDNSALIVGNLRDGLNNTPEHRACVDCMTCITRRSQSTDECWNCPIAAGCGWCSAYNWECFGTQNKRATFICCMHKARSLAIYYYGRRKGEDLTLYCPREWAIEIIGEEEYDRLATM